MLGIMFTGMGVLLLLVGVFGHRHAERGARALGHAKPAMSRKTAIAAGVATLAFGLLLILLGI